MCAAAALQSSAKSLFLSRSSYSTGYNFHWVLKRPISSTLSCLFFFSIPLWKIKGLCERNQRSVMHWSRVSTPSTCCLCCSCFQQHNTQNSAFFISIAISSSTFLWDVTQLWQNTHSLSESQFMKTDSFNFFTIAVLSENGEPWACFKCSS